MQVKPIPYRIDAERWPFIQQSLFEAQAIGGMECVIRPIKAKRSLAQNAIMWAWHDELGQHRGEGTELQHDRFKYKCVLPILLAELDTDEGDQIRKLYELVSMHGGADEIQAFAGRVASSTLLSVKQFTRALEEYDRWAAQKGYVFQKRDNDYDLAMGRN